MKENLHIVGDSSIFDLKYENITVHHIFEYSLYYPNDSTSVAYRMGLLYSIIKQIKQNEWILLPFGDIDCRYYLPIHVNNENDRFIYTKICAYGYIELVKELIDKFPNHKFIVMGPLPIHPLWFNIYSDEYATPLRLNYLAMDIIEKMRDLCSDSNIPFVSIFHLLVDRDIETNIFIYDDSMENIRPHLIYTLLRRELRALGIDI